MKQCCLCGKSGHEASECKWNFKISPITHDTKNEWLNEYVGYGKTRCLCCGEIHTVNLPCPSMRVE